MNLQVSSKSKTKMQYVMNEVDRWTFSVFLFPKHIVNSITYTATFAWYTAVFLSFHSWTFLHIYTYSNEEHIIRPT